jgi:OOP family OmpA-OmpF porin
MKQISHKNLGLLLAMFLLPLSQQSLADSGWYVGGSLGKTYVDENIDGIQFTADSTSFRLSGGYEFNDYFGVEASYLDLGTFKDTVDVGGQMIPVSATAHGYTLAATGRLSMSQRFAVKGRIGYYFSDGEATVDGITEDDPSENNPFVGVGLAFSPVETVRLSLDFDYMDGDEIQPLVATLGFSIHF